MWPGKSWDCRGWAEERRRVHQMLQGQMSHRENYHRLRKQLRLDYGSEQQYQPCRYSINTFNNRHIPNQTLMDGYKIYGKAIGYTNQTLNTMYGLSVKLCMPTSILPKTLLSFTLVYLVDHYRNLIKPTRVLSWPILDTVDTIKLI